MKEKPPPSIPKDAGKMIKPMAIFLWRKVDYPATKAAASSNLAMGGV
jgi:hypothetical protein